MNSPSSPLSSTSSLTAEQESVGAPSTTQPNATANTRRQLDTDQVAFHNLTPSKDRLDRSSSSSSTLTTTTVMLPSDDDRDESDLTEAEDDEPEVEQREKGQARDVFELESAEQEARVSPGPSEQSQDSDRSSRSSLSLSPLPRRGIPVSQILPFRYEHDVQAAAETDESQAMDLDTEVEGRVKEAENSGTREATPASDGEEQVGSNKGEDSEADDEQASSDEEYKAEAAPPDLNPSAPPSPTSNRSQSEHEDIRPDGNAEMDVEVDESVAEGSVADDDESVTSPLFATARTGHSSHAPPPTADAMRAMFLLELKFAALRDQLYIDRMEESAREEDLILTGLHPAVVYLHSTLIRRRERLHADANRRHRLALLELERVRDQEKEAVANWWLETREATQWQQYEGNWRKRRRLNREKNELEILRPIKSLPPRNPSEKDMADRSFCWSTGPRAITLSAVDVGDDLTNMGLRSRPPTYSRHASPAYYPPNHSNPMLGLYGNPVPKPSNMLHNVYRSAPQPQTPAYYTEEGPDYHHQTQGPSHDALHRHGNGPATKHVVPPRLYNHAANGYGVESPEAFSQSPSAQLNGSSSLHQAQRREGRMVPTTSDAAHIFDVRRREKDRVGREKGHERVAEVSMIHGAAGSHEATLAREDERRASTVIGLPRHVLDPTLDTPSAEQRAGATQSLSPKRPSTESPGPKVDRVSSTGAGAGGDRAHSAQPPNRFPSHSSSALAWTFGDRPYVGGRSNTPEMRHQAIAIESAE